MRTRVWGAVVAAAALAGCAPATTDGSPDRPGEPGTGSVAASTMATARPASATSYRDQVARGRYLVAVMDCNGCHTPWAPGPNGPAPDMTRALSGHPQGLEVGPPPEERGPWIVAGTGTLTAWSGPWGITFSPNLTPDDETGIGSWSEEVFVETIRNAKHMGTGRPILPPMPIAALRQLDDDDLRAMYAYLRTIPAIRNRVPPAVLNPPPEAASATR